ncbi:MAG TPA: hypothetical protein VNR65_05780, partial [Geobacterales bacterium]|nr:hypothetical protein [Geobacterales bacterium]
MMESKAALSFCFVVRLYRKTASHLSGRTRNPGLSLELQMLHRPATMPKVQQRKHYGGVEAVLSRLYRR